MNVFRKFRRFSCPRFILCGAFLAVLLAACSTSQQATSTNTNVPANLQIGADLQPSPTGTAELTWAKDGTLTVNISATGLAPNSTHPEHIHAGTCASNPMGPIIHKLNPLRADAHGNGASKTIITGVKNGILASGWYVNVHNGPTLSAGATLSLDQARPIACGNVANQQAKQTAQLDLKSMAGLDGNVHGSASILLVSGQPVVKLTVSGLAPGSMHMVTIHRGTCQSQGSMIDILQSVSNGTATLTISNQDLLHAVSNAGTFSTQLYIMVHEAANRGELNTQTGFDPLACGNITVR